MSNPVDPRFADLGTPAPTKPKPAWYKRKGILITGGVLGALILIGAVVPSENDGKDAVATQKSTTATPKPACDIVCKALKDKAARDSDPNYYKPSKPSPDDPDALEIKWKTLDPVCEYGYAKATADIKNVSTGTVDGAVMTLTASKGSRQIASMTGSIDNLTAGQTRNVEFIGSGCQVTSGITWDFDVELSY